MLGVDHVERELRGDPLQAAIRPASRRGDGEDRRALEILARAAPARRPAWSRKCATTTSTPRGLRARRILIGSIAVPSYSPGIGNDVTIKTRIVAGSILHGSSSHSMARPRTLQFRASPPLSPVPGRRRIDHADRLAAVALAVAEGAAHAAVEGLDGGVKDAPGGVEVAGPEGIRVARQAGAGEGERLGAEHPASGRTGPGAAPAARSPRRGGTSGSRRGGWTAGPDRPMRSRASAARRTGARGAIRDRTSGWARRARPRSRARAARPRPGAAGGWGRRAGLAARAGPARRPPGGPGPRRWRCRAAAPRGPAGRLPFRLSQPALRVEMERVLVEAMERADDRLDHPARRRLLAASSSARRDVPPRAPVPALWCGGPISAGPPKRSVTALVGCEGRTARDGSSGMGEDSQAAPTRC